MMSYIKDTPTGYLLYCPYCNQEVETTLLDIVCPNCKHEMHFPTGVDW